MTMYNKYSLRLGIVIFPSTHVIYALGCTGIITDFARRTSKRDVNFSFFDILILKMSFERDNSFHFT